MSSTEFAVSQVTDEETLQEVYRLRYDIFTADQAKFVSVADHDRRTLIDDLDAASEHYAVKRQGDVVASLRMHYRADMMSEAMIENLALADFAHIDRDKMSFSGRLFVLAAHRRTRALILLLQNCYRVARERGAKLDVIFCNPHLVSLYEQLGYRRYRDCFEDTNLGFQVPLVMIYDDLAHFEAVRSPFLSVARNFPAGSDLADWFKEIFPEYGHFVSPITAGAERFMEIMSEKICDTDSGLLHGMDPEERDVLIASTMHLEVAAGTRVIRKGDFGKELYLILDGVAEARLPRERGDVVLATFGNGDIFGEMALISARPRSADVVARTPLEVIYFDDDKLGRLVKFQPAIAAKLLYNLSRILTQRLENTTHQVLDLKEGELSGSEALSAL